ncbi:PE-PGRS family protein [Mycobacterium tuberculosis]|nr:PE-PGRS family protein [Mycobacterium tuberculosis]
MSFVIAAPDLVAMATEDLAGIGASLTAANAAAAVPTSGLLAAAGDEVSAAIAALFSSHGQQYQAMSAQAAAFDPGLCRHWPGLWAPMRPPKRPTRRRCRPSSRAC